MNEHCRMDGGGTGSRDDGGLHPPYLLRTQINGPPLGPELDKKLTHRILIYDCVRCFDLAIDDPRQDRDALMRTGSSFRPTLHRAANRGSRWETITERAGTVLLGVISVLSLPVMLLNFGGGIVGGIWLLILGNWALLGSGLLSMLISSLALSLALAPGLLFSGPGVLALGRRQYVIGSIALLLENLWTFVVMIVWCVGSFYVVLGSYYTGGSIWPYLLWAYGMATGPWTYMAAREGQDSIGSHLSAFGACIGAIVIMGVLLFDTRPTLIDIAVGCCIPLLVVLVIQLLLAFMMMREEKREF
jgi:hypothetical protein